MVVYVFFTIMKRLLIIFIISINLQHLFAQKLSITTGFNLGYGGLFIVESKRDDYKSSKPLKYPSLWFDLNYKPKKIIYSLSVKNSLVGHGFIVKNLYTKNIDSNLLGIPAVFYGTGLDIVQVNLAAAVESKKYKPFVGKATVKFQLKAGIGIGFNLSKAYYARDDIKYESWGSNSANDINKYESFVTRGQSKNYLISLAGAVSFYNKNKKRSVLSIEAYYDFGLRKMISYVTNYEYGRFLQPVTQPIAYIDPTKYTKVVQHKSFSRGSNFGVKIGIPITIIKK